MHSTRPRRAPSRQRAVSFFVLARASLHAGRQTPTALAFNPDALPKESALPKQSIDQLQQLESKLREKDEKLAELLSDKNNLDAELVRLRAEIAAAKKANAATPDAHNYSEEETRDYFIDILLKEAGWALDRKRDREFEVAGMPNIMGVGFVDYVLWATVDRKLTEAQKHSALRQILDNAVVSEGVLDVFALAGLQKPNIGLLSKEFLEDVRAMPQKNLAVELLEKLLRDEIKAHTRTNVVLNKKFSERLLEALRKYHNRAIETAQVIEELLQMASDFKDALNRNEQLGLNADEVAFYDALAERPEVLQTMGDATLKQLAVELTEQLRKSTTVDWQVRDSVRARMRILIKRLLKKYKYPPEGQDEAVVRVLEQAETLADDWSR